MIALERATMCDLVVPWRRHLLRPRRCSRSCSGSCAAGIATRSDTSSTLPLTGVVGAGRHGAAPLWNRRRPSSFRCFGRSNHVNVPNIAGDFSNHVGPARERPTPTINSEKEGYVSPLVRFDSAVIKYPSSRFDSDVELESKQILETNLREEQRHLNGHQNGKPGPETHQLNTFDLNIWPNRECGSGGGGHVVLGRNASGKTLLSRSVVHNRQEDSSQHAETSNPFLHSGDLSKFRRNVSKNRNHHFLSHVSFDSHSDLLLNETTTTVHRALIPSGGNRLSPTAKFLAVRLGMYPLLPRHVNTLSTGEIRRVLLVRALVSKPELLILDNAFDGLDVAGRQGLQDIIERVLMGFRMDILVQGVGDAKDTARTQVLLLTHRPEEIADGMGKVTFMGSDLNGGTAVRTEDRMGRTGKELVQSLVSWDGNVHQRDCVNGHCGITDDLDSRPWDMASDLDLPSEEEICSFWEHGSRGDRDEVIVDAKGLKATRDDTVLLSDLNWKVRRGERWHLAGTNGAGKSTLSRLLFRMSRSRNATGCTRDAVISDGSLDGSFQKGGVGWVSTELHLHATHHWGHRIVQEILMEAPFLFNKDMNHQTHGEPSEGYAGSEIDVDIATAATCWLGLLGHRSSEKTGDMTHHPFFSRRFSTLSQGEQKLLLVASAIAQRPSLLVLDEPCQGLDLWNRGHLLGLVERICRNTDLGLIYVTHHEDELIPSVGHRLCLDLGEVTYCGMRRDSS
ncbi:hypothetical protein ACHAWF_006377 [Thalassiosira exigua]